MIMQFRTLQASLFSLLVMLVGVKAAGPVTLHRAGTYGFNPFQSGQAVTVLSATAIGVGSDGGTTYAEVFVNSGMVTLSLPTGTPAFTSFVAVQTVTDKFVEQASWVYKSYADGSGGFNGFEQNCTFTDASKNKAECVEVFRLAVSGTTTQVTTQTATESIKPWFTYVSPQPTSAASRRVSSMWSSAFGIVLAVAYFW